MLSALHHPARRQAGRLPPRALHRHLHEHAERRRLVFLSHARCCAGARLANVVGATLLQPRLHDVRGRGEECGRHGGEGSREQEDQRTCTGREGISECEPGRVSVRRCGTGELQLVGVQGCAWGGGALSSGPSGASTVRAAA